MQLLRLWKLFSFVEYFFLNPANDCPSQYFASKSNKERNQDKTIPRRSRNCIAHEETVFSRRVVRILEL